MQAHDLIQSVMIVMRRDNGEETSVRAFHAVRRADSVRPSYEPIEKVVDDPLMLAMVRADMERDIVSLKKRYERFEEFAELVRKQLSLPDGWQARPGASWLGTVGSGRRGPACCGTAGLG